MHSCSSNQEVGSMQDDDDKDDFKTINQTQLKPKIPRTSISKKEELMDAANDRNS